MKKYRQMPPSVSWTLPVMVAALALSALMAWAQTENRVPSKSHEWDYSALANIPAKWRERRNPMEGDADAVAAGKKLYEQHCAGCHGKDAGGAKRGSSLRVMAVRQATPGELFFILTNGVVRRGMPVWSKLPEPERWQIVSYMKSLHGEPGP